MKIIISNTYEAMSKKAADDITDLTQSLINPVLCTASGDSPAGLYKELIRQVNEKNIDVSGWYFVSLDEWLGMNGHDEGSCRFHLNNQLFHPLQVAENNIGFFDGRAKDPEMECERVENFITGHSGIDIAIVGLGMNGHVGMNEPGTSLFAHIADIDTITQKVGQKYFKKEQQLTHGLTLGISSLMEARYVMLIVSGEKKAAIVQQVLEGKISEQFPASLLRLHKGLRVYLDNDAATNLKIK
jgi:glucosamine-6-phosphate isomerase